MTLPVRRTTTAREAWAATLPRDTRDTLFLLAVIAWVALMQVPHIPWWCSALAAGVLVWRTVLTLRARPLPGWPWRVGLLLLTLAATWWTHKTLLGRDAGVTLIVVLLALKTLELRARRDAFVVFFLGFFTLLTHFFYSQSLLTAAGILVALLGLLTAVVNAHMPVGHPPLRQTAGIAARMALLGAPIMAGAFLLFPRYPRCGACPATVWRAARACPARCRSVRSPSWCWTTASRCVCASTAPCRPSATCTSEVPCSPTSMAWNGSPCARPSRRIWSCKPTWRSPASRSATK
jgi:hypothetical protein